MQLSTDLDARLKKIREEGEERAAERRAVAAGFPYLNLASAPVQVDALKLVPEEKARAAQAALFEARKPAAALAAIDPRGAAVAGLVRDLAAQGFSSVKIFAVSARGLAHLMSFYRYVPQARGEITGRVSIAEAEVERLGRELVGLKAAARAVNGFRYAEQSVTEFLEAAFGGALANRASDIHFEAEERGVKLRYRIDGILHDVAARIPADFYRGVVSRVKLLARLKINVTDRPQDGRFTISLAGREVEIRTAIAPAEFGEVIVLRILDPASIRIGLAELGMREDDRAAIEAQLAEPNGMLLNTGPTGSGKTTTLYAFLLKRYSEGIKIITIEDPIEYHLEGIEQTQVDEGARYTFANGLRSIMRQDPDVILVGEIRDADTAEIALQAALTGHLVFSTIHANDAAGAIPRLLDLGVRPSSIGPALNLVIAQRLVRRLCEKCRRPRRLTAEERGRYEAFLKKLPGRVEKPAPAEVRTYEPKGCAACGEVGFRGRIGIFELFPVGEEAEKLILKGVGEAEVRRYARGEGMVTMQEDGILKVLRGITTFGEVEEVTGKIAWRE